MARKAQGRTAQGALEYLITYGWAILIIVIIGGALFALGVFNPSSWVSNKRATGFSSVQVRDWVFQGGAGNVIVLVLQNKVGDNIYVDEVSTIDGWGNCNTTFANVLVAPDESTQQFPVSCPLGNVESGKQYSLNMQVRYTSNGISHTDFGTITGKAE